MSVANKKYKNGLKEWVKMMKISNLKMSEQTKTIKLTKNKIVNRFKALKVYKTNK